MPQNIEQLEMEKITSEQIKNPEIKEAGFEISAEQNQESVTEQNEEEDGASSEGFSTKRRTLTLAQNNYQRRQKNIENILSQGLEDFYLGLQPIQQIKFKQLGEKTSREINNLLSQTKVKTKKIIILIKKWFSMIPGINKIFLEQEAKIKKDKILKIKE